MTEPLISIEQAKAQAKQMRDRMAEAGTPIKHGQSLEEVAHRHGFRDWNTLVAAIETARTKTWSVGDPVTGRYLSKPFTGRVVSVRALKPGWVRLELQLDEPVDVAASDAFSVRRQRLRGNIGPKGHTMERTSDGRPHLEVDLL